MDSRPLRVLVSGGGIGGLTAAAALAGIGADVTVIEARPHNGAVGVGLNQPANALRVLRGIGALEACLDAGFQFDRGRYCDAEGRLIVEVPSRFGGDGIPANNAMPRPVLHEILTATAVSAGAELRLGLAVTGVSSDDEAAVVELSDGRSEAVDLVLAFDGIRSTLRRQLYGSDADPMHTGFGVWRVTVPRHPGVTCTEMYQGLRTKAGFIPLGPDTMYLLAVVAEPPDARFPPELLADLLIDRLGEFGGLVGEIRDAGFPAEQVVYSPLEEVWLTQPWQRGCVVLGGDAAHASAPHLTQGAAMAMEDGWVLASMLAGEGGAGLPLPQILASWEQRRRPRVALVQEVSHRILESEAVPDPAALADRLRRMPEEIPSRVQGTQDRLNQPA